MTREIPTAEGGGPINRDVMSLAPNLYMHVLPLALSTPHPLHILTLHHAHFAALQHDFLGFAAFSYLTQGMPLRIGLSKPSIRLSCRLELEAVWFSHSAQDHTPL